MSLYRKTLCILIAGKAGVGKTTAKNFLKTFIEDDNYPVYADSFALGVKKVAASLGWNGEKDSKGRSLLQKVGQLGREYNPNIWVRQLFNRYEEIAVLPFDAILVDDWRFPNELDFAKKYDPDLMEVITIRIEAPEREVLLGTPEYNEISENSLPSSLLESGTSVEAEYNKYSIYNYSIDNSGTMLTFEYNLRSIYDNLKKLRDTIE